MEQITLSEIVVGLGLIVALFGYVKTLTAPITEFKREVEAIKLHQDNDNKRLNTLEKDTRMILKATRTLVAHGVDSNHTGELKKMQDELDEYLINK